MMGLHLIFFSSSEYVSSLKTSQFDIMLENFSAIVNSKVLLKSKFLWVIERRRFSSYDKLLAISVTIK